MARLKAECHEDRYSGVMDWYTERLKMFSPTMDGNDTELVLFDPTSMLKKAAITSADGGAFNAVYDMDVFIQYATKTNQFGVLPKKPWGRLGFRGVTTGGVASGIGVAEGQAIGTAKEPTYQEIGLAIKEIEAAYDFSDRMYAYDSIADVVTIDQNRDIGNKAFYKSWNADLLGINTTLAGYNFESIDRIISSYSEWSGDASMTTGDANPWTYTVSSITRTAAATAFDAYVSHNSGTDRTLTIAHIDGLRENVEPYWDRYENKAFVTGYDTWRRWSALEETKHRIETTTYNFTVGDGIQTSSGAEGGFKLASWDGIPIIRDDNVQKDTISRVYLEDLDNLYLAMARPPTYTEADPTSQDVFAVGHIWRGVHYAMGETYCTKFKSQGKLRDLK